MCSTCVPHTYLSSRELLMLFSHPIFPARYHGARSRSIMPRFHCSSFDHVRRFTLRLSCSWLEPVASQFSPSSCPSHPFSATSSQQADCARPIGVKANKVKMVAPLASSLSLLAYAGHSWPSGTWLPIPKQAVGYTLSCQGTWNALKLSERVRRGAPYAS